MMRPVVQTSLRLSVGFLVIIPAEIGAFEPAMSNQGKGVVF